MKLVIANKAYSSWSLRPWMLLTRLGHPVRGGPHPARYAGVPRRGSRPTRRAATVPILVDGDVTVWESLAIMDYLADRFPDKRGLAEDIKARAFARTISAEMHAGFRGCAPPAR